MIIEGLVTTLDAHGRLNVAPMGPCIEASSPRFLLRPYRSATTYRNLKETGQGVFHVTDDALMLARTAIGLDPAASTQPARSVRGAILSNACWYREFRVLHCDDSAERATFEVETVAEGRLRDFVGWNRAKHAVIEASILATRLDLLPWPRVLRELNALAAAVEKTGGSDEQEAYALLVRHVHDAAHARGIDPLLTVSGP